MKTIHQIILGLAVLGASVLAPAVPASAHCEIPCGIYDDEMRIAMIRENIDVIEKAVGVIQELRTEPGEHMNQLVRWIENKDLHADKIKTIVSEYFLSQRIKAPSDPADSAAANKYHRELELLHKMIVAAMKAKQTVDLFHAGELRRLVDEFESIYHKH